MCAYLVSSFLFESELRGGICKKIGWAYLSMNVADKPHGAHCLYKSSFLFLGARHFFNYQHYTLNATSTFFLAL